MKVKICGLKNAFEINRIDTLCQPDFTGLIFHESSARNFIDSDTAIVSNDKCVGVFVNQSEEFILSNITKYQLKTIQLHGTESPELCYRLAAFVTVIKAFSIDDQFLFSSTKPYQKACNYFLFDTDVKGQHGGTGRKFNWNKLNEYQGENPFFLSGGIGPNDYAEILMLNHPQFFAVDLNSQFEDAPGIKNDKQLNKF
ncbi:MAG: phosphoribosylanthranilate isomerase, partial [Bacteroidetes bacterium]|nr:phosphoribosylanthranilate isomerase [Bacteroidota bacterium]